jgi:hypothetical protein
VAGGDGARQLPRDHSFRVWDWRPDGEVVVNYSDFLTVLAGVAGKD